MFFSDFMTYRKGRIFSVHWSPIIERLSISRSPLAANANPSKWLSFTFTCQLLFIISTHKLVVSRNFLSIRIVLSCFICSCWEILNTESGVCRLPYTWCLNSLMFFYSPDYFHSPESASSVKIYPSLSYLAGVLKKAKSRESLLGRLWTSNFSFRFPFF